MIAVIDCCGANIASVQFALKRLDAEAILTSDPQIVRQADRVILPGVGAAGAAMRQLQENRLTKCIASLTQPVLGICVGMQLLFAASEEGACHLLNVIPERVRHFTPEPEKTIPHIGWNRVDFCCDHVLLKEVCQGSHFYFAHSYFAPACAYTIGTCSHGDTFSAIVARNNFMGCQFHPERSGSAGAQILKNFLNMPT